MSSRGSILKNQQGMVSIITTMVIMIIMTLVVSSFALVVRREQRQSLDRQLSTQAFYAAETGIGDAIDALKAGKVTGNIDDCNTFGASGSPTAGYSKTIDAENGVSYSCVLITSPDNLAYPSVDPDDGSFGIPINPASNINRLRLSWQNKDGSSTFVTGDRVTNHALPQNGVLETAMMKVTLVSTSNLSRDALVNSSQTFYLYPNGHTAASSAGSRIRAIGPADAGNAVFVRGNCNAGNTAATTPAYPRYCNVDITGLGGAAVSSDTSSYFLLVKAYYKPADLVVTGYQGSTRVVLNNAQAVVDVTGKASDVLRRLQVRVPVAGGEGYQNLDGRYPEAGLEATNGICKMLQIIPGQFSNQCGSNQSLRPIGEENTTND